MDDSARRPAPLPIRPSLEPDAGEDVSLVDPSPVGAADPRVDVGRRADERPAAPADLEGKDAAQVAERRAGDLRLARLHLRLGSLTLALAELEAAHAALPLDGGALLDLAEARWRSGDLADAGAAAETVLDAPGATASLLATVIAVEAALADGRPSDARRRREALPEVTLEALEAVCGGMPRSDLWPPETGAASPLDPARASTQGTRAPTPSSAGPAGLRGTGARPASTAAGSSGGGGGSSINALAELDAARADLEAGQDAEAAIRLALVLRLVPHLAPAVLELLEGSSGPLPDLVRGDAYRLVGRATEADRAWRAAAAQVALERSARERRAATGPRPAPYAATPAAAVAPHGVDAPALQQAIPADAGPDREPQSEETP